MGIQAIKELQLQLDFSAARDHPVSPVRNVGGDSRQFSSSGGDCSHGSPEVSPVTRCGSTQTCAVRTPQQPVDGGKGTYLTVAFLSSREEEANRLLADVEASMSPTLAGSSTCSSRWK
eukprot:GHVS01068499.1.p1 GENE.GHVS01068499.1~~GHVS01068499.1.p1  ORF type:complete len:118 (-),score=14.52 GHVS01068499.1:84-437(-)